MVNRTEMTGQKSFPGVVVMAHITRMEGPELGEKIYLLFLEVQKYLDNAVLR